MYRYDTNKRAVCMVRATTEGRETESIVAKRGAALELAVLGLLHESPMHGYELRKRVNTLFGWGRVLSYGTLYPCLKQLLRAGLITQADRSEERRVGKECR